jgi:threonine dehydrogenase-like Zn-dependent dehydrogenase
MQAVTWHGTYDVRVEEVADPRVHRPTDAVIRVTSTAICGSDLHLLGPLGAFMREGDVLGHEPMGIVEEVGSAVTGIAPGDRVVVPFNVSCGLCFMCDRQLFSQCETTQVRVHGTGAALLGYSELYGGIPGGQAQYLRVPMAHFGPVKVAAEGPDERYLFLSDVLPTAWQAAVYADVPEGGTAAVFGLGPVGQMTTRVLHHLGAARVIGLDPEPDRRAVAEKHGVEVVDPTEHDDVPGVLAELVDGRGPDAVVDAVGMEAHGSPAAATAHRLTAMLPDALARPFLQRGGVDRLAALHAACRSVRRGGTVSISGVYGGELDPMPLKELFDRQVQLRMGQANVKRWIPEILPLVEHPADPLGVLDLTTQRLPLAEAPDAYRRFRDKEDGWVKVVLDPWA